MKNFLSVILMIYKCVNGLSYSVFNLLFRVPLFLIINSRLYLKRQ